MNTFVELSASLQQQPQSLFLGKKLGLIENYSHKFDSIWFRYKQLKSLDWSEDEIDISSCNAEFKSVPRDISEAMIRTLAWQWEADSEACHVGQIFLPFINNTELFAYFVENMKNEILHALSYKFIVEHSFDEPHRVMEDILAIKESLTRLEIIERVFEKAYNASLDYAKDPKFMDEYELRFIILQALVALLSLERIQFISSFAITFGLAEQNYFVPIAKLVQKICNDELQVHVQADKDILTIEKSYPLNAKILKEQKLTFQKIVDEVVHAEISWIKFLFQNQKEIAGITKNELIKFVQFNAQDVYTFLDLSPQFEKIHKNPLPYMNKWIHIDAYQASPQEESVNNYLLGMFVDDSEEYFKTLKLQSF